MADALAHRVVADEIPVLAIVGDYGDGKTSLLEMMAERLRRQRIVLVRFKTSLPGDESTLVSTLFKSISKELHRRFFMRRLRAVLNRYARVLAGVIPALPSGMKDIFRDVSQEEELEELSSRLERLPIARVIVMLDDMDRMQRGELQALLKIVRGIENYPKLCFVCAFNKDALVETLIRVQTIDRVALNFSATQRVELTGTIGGDITADDMRAGYQFLEKFFPVQIPIPKLDDKQLARQFDKRLEEFTSHYGLLTLPDDAKAFESKLTDLWPKILRPALHNVRRLNTYFNALKMSYELVKNEVNLIDFMCIELLRQDEPAIYQEVFKNRRFFYFPSWDIEHWGERVDISEERGREIHRTVFNDMFRRLHGGHREYILALIGEMFPKVDDYGSKRDIRLNPHDEGEADRDKRIYHPAYFMVYFSLHVPEGYYGIGEFNALTQTVNEKTKDDAVAYFRGYLKVMDNLKRMRFLDRVNASLAQFRDPAARAFVCALSWESELFEEADFGLGDFSAARRSVFIIANRFRATDEITGVLQDAISKATTDAFAQTIFAFSTDREHNSLIEAEGWDHISADALQTAFISRMEQKYAVGSANSIFDSKKRQDWQALIAWYRIRPESARAYLRDEFQRRPGSIGKYLLWLFPSITHSKESREFVDQMFPLKDLKTLAINAGPQAYSSGEHTDGQKKVINRLLKDDLEGNWPY